MVRAPRTFHDIRNAGDPANDGAVGITIRNGHDPEKRILRSPFKGDLTFVLDAFARKHALNAGADGFKCGFAHYLGVGRPMILPSGKPTIFA
jgi:hypothetical protein